MQRAPVAISVCPRWCGIFVVVAGLTLGCETPPGPGDETDVLSDAAAQSAEEWRCPPTNEPTARARFAACMEMEDWVDTGMCRVTQQETPAGSCVGCHSDEHASTYFSERCTDGFEALRARPQLLMDGLIFTLPHDHPEIQWDAGALVAIDEFLFRTYDRYLDCNRSCTPR